MRHLPPRPRRATTQANEEFLQPRVVLVIHVEDRLNAEQVVQPLALQRLDSTRFDPYTIRSRGLDREDGEMARREGRARASLGKPQEIRQLSISQREPDKGY